MVLFPTLANVFDICLTSFFKKIFKMMSSISREMILLMLNMIQLKEELKIKKIKVLLIINLVFEHFFVFNFVL